MPDYRLNLSGNFRVTAPDQATAAAQADNILYDLQRHNWGEHAAIGQFSLQSLTDDSDLTDRPHAPGQPLPDLTALQLPEGWQEQPSYRTSPEYRLLLRTSQGADPAIEVRLDNRRKHKLSQRLRIRPQNAHGRELARHGIPIAIAYTNMAYFNELLRAHQQLNAEPAPAPWLEDFLELTLLLKARQTVTEGIPIAHQAALVPHDLQQDLTQRLGRLNARLSDHRPTAANAPS